MNNNDKILNLLGLAQRARKLITGEELVIKEIQKQKAKLVFIASDLGPSTMKKVTDKAKTYNVSYNDQFSHIELSSAIGQSRKVIAVMDAGFAKKLKELIKN
ncbi:MAG: YlxQ-related RNA-binding protein [Streptococcaceae bacterium]|jgi:ribosomal protein L7Ae-like RNA K-turn-binding protein|nr:YlxQ-related RNA-binding protein [Streptococcaceae bacterium]